MIRTLILAGVFFLAALAAGEDDVEVHIMSFNIRTSQASTDAGSTCSNWDGIRKDNVLSNIKTVAADFVGTQETSDAQKAYLDAQLTGTYSVIGESTGSLNGNAAEWNALYYRSDTWTVVTNGMFWLGPDPNAMTSAWGMTYYRTCVWGRFKHIATGATICVMNTHYETPGNDEAQENGSNIILEKIKTNCDAGDNLIVVTGDFNALKSYSAMQIMFANNMQDPDDEGTFCGDMLSSTCSVKYDFTLYRTQSDKACHLKSEISRIDYSGCYSSDHAGLIGSFCLQGDCCSNSSSSTSGSADQIQIQDESAANEADVVGKVQASDLSPSTDTTQQATSGSSSGPAQSISTSSGGGGGASTTVGIILGSLGFCGIVALVIIRRKKVLDTRAHFEKAYDPNASYFSSTAGGAARAVSDMSALSPLPEERVSNSPIPELVAAARDSKVSRTSSISASGSEVARHDGDRRSSVSESSSRRSSTVVVMDRRSSTAVMDHSSAHYTNSEYSSSFSNSVLESESDFNPSISSYAESYAGNSSIAMSKVNFSEIFAPDSCVSDESEIAKSDFAKL
ncbi:hypothetical protein PHYBOEH_001029 [Phytophthora boehmeriae]|uniref:Endonuclease/exonuclease/phosphatase domain-containing protein n=1 Tax=Phytophthora boehmeriae TaxID=109152 RepID=A0A8T1X807_9STRA|nr:hypothetical protein PHYBOEH_001029 [Phytophthora boehmeriae]